MLVVRGRAVAHEGVVEGAGVGVHTFLWWGLRLGLVGFWGWDELWDSWYL